MTPSSPRADFLKSPATGKRSWRIKGRWLLRPLWQRLFERVATHFPRYRTPWPVTGVGYPTRCPQLGQTQFGASVEAGLKSLGAKTGAKALTAAMFGTLDPSALVASVLNPAALMGFLSPVVGSTIASGLAVPGGEQHVLLFKHRSQGRVDQLHAGHGRDGCRTWRPHRRRRGHARGHVWRSGRRPARRCAGYAGQRRHVGCPRRFHGTCKGSSSLGHSEIYFWGEFAQRLDGANGISA